MCESEAGIVLEKMEKIHEVINLLKKSKISADPINSSISSLQKYYDELNRAYQNICDIEVKEAEALAVAFGYTGNDNNEF